VKVLVIDEEFPFPPNSGKRIRSFSLLKRLAQNHNLTYLAYGDPDSESYQQLKVNNMNPVAVDHKVPPKSGIGFYFRLFLNLFSKYPYIVDSHYSDKFAAKLDELLSEARPELIICEWTPYAIFVKDLKRVKKIIATHNVEARIWQRYYENEQNIIKKWYIKKQWIKLSIFERDSFHWVDGATAVSEIDADEIHSFNHKLMVKAVDNGVDLEYFTPAKDEPNPQRVVFVGTMDWRPNQDATLYFVENIFPLLKKKAPAVEVFFVGRNAPEQLTALNKIDGITVTGSGEDVRPYIDEASVYIVPLRIGGGTRLKILDAMAMKKAIVSTTVGAEGLEVTDGENIILADTPEDFANKICTIMEDGELRHRLGENGRKLVEEKYGWDSIGRKLDDFIKEVTV